MGLQDNKGFSLNISARQLVGIVIAFALCAVAIYANALTVGFIVVTLALCLFFLAVGFDYGVREKQFQVEDEPDGALAADTSAKPRTKSSRRARTA
jgi:hypothetical protein